MKFEVVAIPWSDRLRLVKDIDTFNGPNMWNLEVKNRYDVWETVQWMNVYNAERMLDVTLPKYEEELRTW